MVAMDRIGQNVAAALAALLFTVTTVGAAVGPAHNVAPHATVAGPAALVAAQVSSQA